MNQNDRQLADLESGHYYLGELPQPTRVNDELRDGERQQLHPVTFVLLWLAMLAASGVLIVGVTKFLIEFFKRLFA